MTGWVFLCLRNVRSKRNNKTVRTKSQTLYLICLLQAPGEDPQTPNGKDWELWAA